MGWALEFFWPLIVRLILALQFCYDWEVRGLFHSCSPARELQETNKVGNDRSKRLSRYRPEKERHCLILANAKGLWKVAVVTETGCRSRKTHAVKPVNMRVVSPPSACQLREKLPADVTAAVDSHADAFRAWVEEREKTCATLKCWNNMLVMVQLCVMIILNTRCTQGNFATIQSGPAC